MIQSNTVFLLRALPLLCVAGVATFSTGCSDDVPSNDGGPIPPNGGRDAAPDDVISDASPNPDSDAGCVCTPAAAGEKGALSLPCFCDRADLCLDYDSARSNCRDGAETWLDVHAACNLEVISFPEGLAEGRKLVFDAMTHTLVGASYASDTLSLVCGTERVVGYQAGTFPSVACPVSQHTTLCGADAGNDGDVDDGDTECTCTLGDAASGPGRVSLPCYCGGGFGECPSYEVALTICPPGAPAEFIRLEEYADCNYAVITSGGGLGGTKYVYDYTTHELVGASRFTDVNILACGAARVFAYEAGAFPGPSCVQTNAVNRCGADGGNASADIPRAD